MSRNLEQGILSHPLQRPWLSQGFGPSANVEVADDFTPRYRSICSTLSPGGSMAEDVDVMAKIRGQNLWTVNSRRRNGLILYKQFYTEFAGPGAAIGGSLDTDCRSVIALGSLSLVAPESIEDQQKALRIRLQWVRLTQNFTDKPVALDRARMILEQFKNYFDQSIVDQVPDEAFALLVGVLPPTVRRARALL
ncbi:MAG: hypothetical protein ACKO21_02095 [Nodosilinea sp.]|jgi:hypothetical protein